MRSRNWRRSHSSSCCRIQRAWPVLYEEPMIYMIMTIWCVARSSDVVSGELGRGTMEILLSQPVSRRQAL